MKDEQEEIEKPPEELLPISLNSETGELKIDEVKFSLQDKPYAVRKLL